MKGSNRQQREAMHGDAYAKQFAHERQTDRVARLVERIVLPRDAAVLDAGCGTGILAELLARRYGTYTGVDFSPAMVEECRARVAQQDLRNCEFLCVDLVEHMHGSKGEYDAIFMLDISEHVPDREWADIVAASRHALKSGGKVYLHTPNLDFAVERLKQRGWMRQLPEHVAVRDTKSNKQFFEKAGFMTVTVEALPHYNVLRLLHNFSGVPVIGKYFAARVWIEAVR